MATTQFSCEISNSDPAVPLVLKIYIDGANVLTLAPVPAEYYFESTFEDSELTQTHTIEFELLGKSPEHTVVDDQGNIVKDALITVENFQIDDIDISSILTGYPNALYNDVPTHIIKYCHDFNGTQPALLDTFHGMMGCNGTVTLKFTTPVYLWLLENM